MILRSLVKHVSKDVRTVTGRNIQVIQKETGEVVRPGLTKPTDIQNWQVNVPLDEDLWRLGLLESLLEIRDSSWETNYDEEAEESSQNEIQTLINDVCKMKAIF